MDNHCECTKFIKEEIKDECKEEYKAVNCERFCKLVDNIDNAVKTGKFFKLN